MLHNVAAALQQGRGNANHMASIVAVQKLRQLRIMRCTVTHGDPMPHCT
jgi:hypothetical protein